MKALVFNNQVIQLEQHEFPVCPEMVWMSAPEGAQVGWVLEHGELIPAPPHDKTQEEILHEFNYAIQSLLDSVARSKQYDSSLHCASYATSSVPLWSSEANAFIEWRDSVWSYSYAELAKFENGEREAPTVEEFVSELPVMVWPE